jgi:glycerol kinase
MYFFTRSEKFLTASQMEFNADYASIRTSYYLNNHPKLNKEIQKANTNIVWGTIDSWILWNLTHNHIHATDFSNASSTGMLDPFTLEWNKLVLDKLGIPLHILPSLKNTNANFSTTKIFGTPAIPIRCIFADQQASMFGQCCFNKGEMKVTNGTGSFVDLNTGESPHASKRKLYPLIAWRTDNKTIYKLEGMSHNTGNIIDWIKDELELFSDYDELEELVRQADSDGNVFFLPTFSSGISYPYWDPTARGNIFGISLKTTKADILQAVLNGIAFRIKDFVHGIIKDTGVKITQIKADGGVSRNQYFLQFLSDILGLKVIHSEHPEPTALGAAFMAGLATGFFKSKEELVKLCQTNEVYEPQISKEKRNNLYASWKDIVKRSLNYRH